MKKLILSNTIWTYPILLSIIILVYCQVLGHDFLYYWDDQWVVINHYTTGGLNISNLWSILTDFYHGQYAPLNELNYLLLYTFFDYEPLYFHAISLCWHLANACLVYYFFSILLENSKISFKWDTKMIAFITALLWGVHPVNVESVAWISASKVLIYAFFYLLSLVCYLKYIQCKRNIFFLFTLLFFICSFLGKEQAVTLPICLLLIDYFLDRDLLSKEIWLEKISFFSLALLGGFLTILSQGNGSDDLVYSLNERVVFACYTLFEYFVKSILPINLSYIYPFPILPGESMPLRMWIYPVIILILISMLVNFRKNIVLIFSVLFLVIHVAVALHLISLSRYAIVADRYLYLGNIGVSFFIVWAVYRIIDLFSCNWKKMILLGFFFTYLLYLASYSFSYTKDWKDTDSLKQHLRGLLENRKQNVPLKKYVDYF